MNKNENVKWNLANNFNDVFFFHSIHILTWNVSSKFPENLPIHILFGLEKKSENDTHRPDFFVIG